MASMPTNTLFVRSLPSKCPLADVEAVFSTCSGFLGARVREDRNKATVAFVDFDSPEAARRAMEARTGARIHDRPISFDFAQSQGKGAQKRPREGEAPGGRDPLPLPSSAGKRWNEEQPPGGSPLTALAVLQPERPVVLEVAGIPADASLREIGHIFRPFPGFMRIEASGRDLHHAEFRTAAQAGVACCALENYLFEKGNPASPRLNLRFA